VPPLGRSRGRTIATESRKAIPSDANLLAEDPVKDSHGNLFITRADAQIPCAAGR
jgi:hypothetical protein